MTGYGQAAGENERYRVAVSARSVNHRFLDLALRLPEEFRSLERDLRSVVDARLSRGRVELKVAVETLAPAESTVTLNRALVDEILEAVRVLETEGLSDRPLDRADLLRIPEVLRVDRTAGTPADEDRAMVIGTVTEAIEALVSMRRVEGEALAGVLGERIAMLDGLAARLGEEREAVRDRLLEAMRARIAALVDQVDVDGERLAQEVAILAEKTDIQEELDRLRGHLDHCNETLVEDGPIGRRLDFLAQEIHRELNTLGAKCRDLDMAQRVVDAKVTCEQLREQIQNVE